MNRKILIHVFLLFFGPKNGMSASNKKIRGQKESEMERRNFNKIQKEQRKAHRFTKHSKKHSKKHHHHGPIVGPHGLLLFLPIPIFGFGFGLAQSNCSCREGKLSEIGKSDSNCECLCFCNAIDSSSIPVFMDDTTYDVDPIIINPDDETCGCMEESLYTESTSSPTAALNLINPILSFPSTPSTISNNSPSGFESPSSPSFSPPTSDVSTPSDSSNLSDPTWQIVTSSVENQSDPSVLGNGSNPSSVSEPISQTTPTSQFGPSSIAIQSLPESSPSVPTNELDTLPSSSSTNNPPSDQGFVNGLTSPGDTVTSQLHRPPVAVDDFYYTNKNQPLAFAPLQNDSGADMDSLFIWSFEQTSHGLVTSNPDETLMYFPDLNFTGLDYFEYIVGDSSDELDTAVVAIRVFEEVIVYSLAQSYTASALVLLKSLNDDDQ